MLVLVPVYHEDRVSNAVMAERIMTTVFATKSTVHRELCPHCMRFLLREKGDSVRGWRSEGKEQSGIHSQSTLFSRTVQFGRRLSDFFVAPQATHAFSHSPPPHAKIGDEKTKHMHHKIATQSHTQHHATRYAQ